jgi:hypothetical protein
VKPKEFLDNLSALREDRSYYDYRSNQPCVDRIDRKIEEITQSLIERDRFLVEANKKLVEALKAVAAIEDKMYGGDWDEIEEARNIACAALKELGEDV